VSAVQRSARAPEASGHVEHRPAPSGTAIAPATLRGLAAMTEKIFPAPSIERASATSNVVEVLDRVLDKGIVIDAWVRVSLVGIELVTVEARVVVASIATYLCYADVLAPKHTTAQSF
jgi:hypothetical protein